MGRTVSATDIVAPCFFNNAATSSAISLTAVGGNPEVSDDAIASMLLVTGEQSNEISSFVYGVGYGSPGRSEPEFCKVINKPLE